MKISKLSALLTAALLTASAATGCLDKKKKSSDDNTQATVDDTPMFPEISTVKHGPVGENKIDGEFGKEVSGNGMVFKLNSIIDSGKRENGNKFLFFDIELTNETSDAYTISTLNNFYIRMPDGSDIYSDVRSQLLAQKEFNSDKYHLDPFDLPANGTFSGVVGGYTLPEDAEEFTVCFFPTGIDPNAKETVVRYTVTAGDIKEADSDLLK